MHDTGTHGAQHADTQTHGGTAAASTWRCLTRSRLVASFLAQLLQAPASIFFSLSNAVLCGLKVFWNILECIFLCKFVVVVCHVCCAAAYFTKVFVFYFLSFLLNCHYSLLSFWQNILWFVLSAILIVLLCERIYLYLFETLNVMLLSFLRFWMLCCWVFIWDFKFCNLDFA